MDQVKPSSPKKREETYWKGQCFAKQLYQKKEFRRPETIRELSEDPELAEVTVKAYVKYFDFRLMSLISALQSFLKVLWPVDEPELHHLFLTHFSIQYLRSHHKPFKHQPAFYHLSWAMIVLNADLNGGHKERKMTCDKFRAKLNREGCICGCRYNQLQLILVYEFIETKPLEVFGVRTRYQSEEIKEISVPEDSGCSSMFETENDPKTVHKTGNLICKRVSDKNGRNTRKGQRAWKKFTAVLKGMVLHLQNDASDTDDKNAINLHHAVAYPLDHKKRPHVLCLMTADSRLFFFQAEDDAEQTSWVAVINRIAARYSAPPLTSASSNMEALCLQVLPSFPSPLSVKQQLEYYKAKLQRVLEHLDHDMTSSLWNGTLPINYTDQIKLYRTYVTALQDLCEGSTGQK